jgi:hypothetical protein
MADFKALALPSNTGQGIVSDFKSDVKAAFATQGPALNSGLGRVLRTYGYAIPVAIVSFPLVQAFGPTIAAEVGNIGQPNPAYIPLPNQELRLQSQPAAAGIAAALSSETSSSEQTTDVAEQAQGKGLGGGAGAGLVMPPVWARDP